MLPLEYFRRRAFSTANGVAFFLSFSLIGSLFMVAQMFQVGLGYNPLQAGLRMLVWTGMPMLVAHRPDLPLAPVPQPQES